MCPQKKKSDKMINSQILSENTDPEVQLQKMAYRSGFNQKSL